MTILIEQEQVLCIHADLLAKLGEPPEFSIDVQKYKDAVFKQGSIVFVDRQEAETNESFKQIIPYQVIKSNDLYFVYRRGKKGSEDRLHARLSIGIGGHINSGDAEDCLTGEEIYQKGSLRELDEEIELPEYYVQHSLGVVYDNSTKVGLVHLGFVELLDLKGLGVKVKDEALDSVGWMTLQELKNNYEKFEQWSRIVIDHLL